MKGRSSPFLPLLLAGALLPAGAQECPQGRISFIFIDNHSIFDLTGMEPGARFYRFYRLANALHIPTSEDFIRDELLFQAGDCLDPLRLEESGRILRGYRFIGRSDVYALPQPDGTQHVLVDTQDEWSTKLDLGIRFEEGLRLEGVELAEENLLGRGILARLFFRERRDQKDLGVEMETPRLLGTRWDARAAYGRGRAGHFFEEGIAYPFVGEVGKVAARQTYVRRETLFPYALPDHSSFTHLTLPFREERAELTFAGRAGAPGNLTLFGVGISRESLDFTGFPGSTEYVRGGDFSDVLPADSAAAEAVRAQARGRTTHRVNFILGQRNLRFVQRRGLDALKGIQDVQVGTEVTLAVGRTLQVEAPGEEGRSGDLHYQAGLFAGQVWEDWTFNAGAAWEARHVYPGRGAGGRWADVLLEADAYLYWQPGTGGPHTLLFRASAAGGWWVEMPYQLTLGGHDALRGYHTDALPGSRRLILTLEDRVYLPWPAPELFDFGLSFFADLGRIQAGGTPFGVSSGWRGAAGAGIRFGLPPGTATTVRVDTALPLGRRTQWKHLILRITLRETLGLLTGFRDVQMERTRRTGVRPDLIGPS